ncbi:MAG: class II aldolase/adducin family protein [Alphaproteobacteria bacterium]
MKHVKQRRELVAQARRLVDIGLNRGTSGNLSARIPGGLLITPSGITYDEMTPGDIVELDARGGAPIGETEGRRLPSSEWRIHLDILAARDEFGAVIHAHPIFATALACNRRAIPAFHYMVAVAGGSSIPLAPYATFGTKALSRNILRTMKGVTACLVANHGIIAAGATLSQAADLAVEVETLAEQYVHALQAGKPKILPKAEMAKILRKFRAYGQQPAPPPKGRRRR